MKPSEVLMGEHRVIEAVLECLDRAAADVEKGTVDGKTFRESLGFFRTFADRCHHHKEEQLLFPALEQHGVPREGGPIGVMLDEHEYGRRCLQNIEQALEGAERGDGAARRQLVREAHNYSSMLRDHILKEDEVLFPMADAHLTAGEQEQILAGFHGVERDELEQGAHGCQVGIARQLCSRWGVPFPTGVATSCGGH